MNVLDRISDIRDFTLRAYNTSRRFWNTDPKYVTTERRYLYTDMAVLLYPLEGIYGYTPDTLDLSYQQFMRTNPGVFDYINLQGIVDALRYSGKGPYSGGYNLATLKKIAKIVGIPSSKSKEALAQSLFDEIYAPLLIEENMKLTGLSRVGLYDKISDIAYNNELDPIDVAEHLTDYI